MRRILVVDNDLHVGQAIAGSEFLRLAARLGATRCLRKPFKPATLLSVIDECLLEAEPHRRQVATLGAMADSLTELQSKPTVSDLAMVARHEPRRIGERLS